MTVDYPDYQTPQAHATAISTTGVPLLHFPSSLNASTPITVPAGTAGQVVNLNSNAVNPMGGFLSYEIHARFTSNSASVKPFLTFIVTWAQDIGLGVILYRERWTIAANALSGGSSLVGAGLVRGAFMGLSVTNEDPTNAMTINGLQIEIGSRPYPNSSPDWRTFNPQLSIPSLIVPIAGNGDDGILGIFNASVPVSSSVNLVAGLFNGTVVMNFQAAGAAGTVTLTPQAYVSGDGYRAIATPIVMSGASLSSSVSLNLPRSNLVVNAANSSGASGATVAMQVIAAAQF